MGRRGRDIEIEGLRIDPADGALEPLVEAHAGDPLPYPDAGDLGAGSKVDIPDVDIGPRAAVDDGPGFTNGPAMNTTGKVLHETYSFDVKFEGSGVNPVSGPLAHHTDDADGSGQDSRDEPTEGDDPDGGETPDETPESSSHSFGGGWDLEPAGEHLPPDDGLDLGRLEAPATTGFDELPGG